MAVEIGTAENFADLYNKLVTFLTTGLGAGQNWEIVHGYEQDDDLTITSVTDFTADKANSNKVILKGVGTGEGGEVFVGMYSYTDPFTEAYTINLLPISGYDPNFNFFSQPTRGITKQPKLLCWDESMKYWFVANVRRFMVVVQVNTTYQFIYGGFFLPYALPTEYPYPYVVGGMSDSHVAASQSDSYNDVFLRSSRREHGQICYPNGNWRYLSGGFHNDTSATLAPYNVAGRGDANNDDFWAYWRPDFGGIYHLLKLEPVCANYATGKGVFGCLDGVHAISGFENSPENIVELDGVEHLVFTNSYRVDNGQYFTMRLL